MIVLGITSLLLALVALLYQEMPLFIPKLPFSWLLRQRLKRIILRLMSLGLLLFYGYNTAIGLIDFVILLITLGMLTGSLILSGERLFKSLKPSELLRSKNTNMPLETLVVGYIGKKNSAVCYPVHELVSPRHIINDNVDGESILITYCPSCGSSAILSRIVDDKPAIFSVTAGIFHKNMVMIDDISGTLWQQAIGEGIKGIHERDQLDFLSFQQMTLYEWRTLYPDTTIVSEKDNAPRALLSQGLTAKILRFLSRHRGINNPHEKLKGTDEVIGVAIGEASKAYPLASLQSLLNSTLNDDIGGVPIKIIYDNSSGFVGIKRTDTGEVVVPKRIWWLGWKEFYPETEVYTFDANDGRW